MGRLIAKRINISMCSLSFKVYVRIGNDVIRAVTFDVWGTLLGYTSELSEYWREARKRSMFKVLRTLGYNYNMSEISKAYDILERKIRGEEVLLPTSCTNSSRQHFESMSEITVTDQVGLFLRLLNVKVQGPWVKELVKLYAEVSLEKLPTCAKNARGCLSQLKDDGIKLGIISNVARTPSRVLRIVLAKHGILEYFDTTSFSDEVYVRKPHPKIFLHALSQLEVKAKDAVHVGDRLRDDVYGAKMVGMRAVLCRSIAPLPLEEEILKPDASIDKLIQLRAALESIGAASNLRDQKD